jgi:hypothetical protein
LKPSFLITKLSFFDPMLIVICLSFLCFTLSCLLFYYLLSTFPSFYFDICGVVYATNHFIGGRRKISFGGGDFRWSSHMFSLFTSHLSRLFCYSSTKSTQPKKFQPQLRWNPSNAAVYYSLPTDSSTDTSTSKKHQ